LSTTRLPQPAPSTNPIASRSRTTDIKNAKAGIRFNISKIPPKQPIVLAEIDRKLSNQSNFTWMVAIEKTDLRHPPFAILPID
jgi:hypothetical protein